MKANLCEMGMEAMMSRRARAERALIYGVSFFYMLLLMKILFLSRISFDELFDGHRAVDRAVNFLPLHSIIAYLSGGTETLRRFSYANVVGNIAIFVPLGAYLPWLRQRGHVAANLLIVAFASLLTEMIQWALGIGTADIDDLLLNCIGGLIGIVGYKLLLGVLRSEASAQTAIAILSILGFPAVWCYLFMIKMKF